VSTCDQCRDHALPYLDGGLSETESRKLRAHLASCEQCQNYLEQEQQLSRLLYASRATDAAPHELRTRVQQLLENAPAPGVFATFRSPLRTWSAAHPRLLSAKIAAAFAVAVAVFVILLFPVGQQVRAGTFVRAAVDAHNDYEDGTEPLEFRSNSPASVTAWIQAHVPFQFRLPEAEHSPDQSAAYHLSGASIFDFKKKKVALVVYQMQTKKISLLVAPADLAILKGGQEVQIGKLTFRYRSTGGLEVITWSNHGLAYALVSPHEGSSAEGSCLVCHQYMADHGVFKQSGQVSFPRPWKMDR